jgi:hypothetical protein
VTDLALGLRMSVAGGRSGWARLGMISAGVGLGVAMLFVAVTVPALSAARSDRLANRAHDTSAELPRADDTMLIAEANSQYGDRTIHGRLVQPEGGRAPLPPGVTRQLAPGEMVASPALARLLDSDEGALLRGRWGERVVGTIGDAGLAGPREYAFYLGTDRLTEQTGTRLRSFGIDPGGDGMDPALLLLGLVALAVLLVPIVIFVTTAVRFGGEARDRQLAAVRLVGADTAMTRRIATGETLVGALLGLVLGGLLYLLVGLVAGRFVPVGMSYYLADYRPVPVLAVLVVVAVPVVSVLVTLSALRRVAVEPLGVVRLSGNRRRRLWWRLILPVVGLALLYPLLGGLPEEGSAFLEFQVLTGVTALLVGVALLLPWVVEATVRRLGGGGVAWQLAVRRLQLDSGTAVRAVSGIAVSVAGVIALQGLLAAVQAQYTAETARDNTQFQALVLPRASDPGEDWSAALAGAAGVDAVGTLTSVRATRVGDTSGDYTLMDVGDCAVLRQIAEIGTCADGDAFVVSGGYEIPGDPGTGYTLGETAQPWTLPATARNVPAGGDIFTSVGGILATPGALAGVRPVASAVDVYVALDPADPDALDRLRNRTAQVDPTALVDRIERRTIAGVLVNIRQTLLVGAVALLVLIGTSMLVNVAEQLRERRRLLAVLVAFGTRRGVLTRSVLCQVAIPVSLGLVLAVATGTGLAAILQSATNSPIRFDWVGIGVTSGAAAAVVLLTTAASLPMLWRLTRPGALRTE